MSNDLSVPNQKANLPAVPDYMKVADDHSLDNLKQYVRPPRIKVVQSTSDEKLREIFGIGSVILVPDNTLILEPIRDGMGNIQYGTTPGFLFTPIFCFTEFCLWNPIQTKGRLPAIRERSFDPNSRVAARARDFNNRTFPCPEEPAYNCVYCEHINFIVHIHGQKEQCIFTFSRGEFKAGTTLAGLAKMRAVPLFGNIFSGRLAARKNAKGSWVGVDCTNPDEGSPFVGEEAFQMYARLNKEYADLYNEKRIDVSYDDEPIDVDPVSDAANSI